MRRDLEEKTEQPNTNLKKRFAILLTCFIFSSILISVCSGDFTTNLKYLGPIYKNVDSVIIASMRKDLKIIFLVLIGMIITVLIINRKEKVKVKRSNSKCMITAFLFIVVFVIFNLVSYRNYIIFTKDTDISMREKRFEDSVLCRQTYECRRYLDKVMAAHQEFMITEYELKKHSRSLDRKDDFKGEAQSYYFLTSY